MGNRRVRQPLCRSNRSLGVVAGAQTGGPFFSSELTFASPPLEVGFRPHSHGPGNEEGRGPMLTVTVSSSGARGEAMVPPVGHSTG